MLTNLLIYRFILGNVLPAFGILIAWYNGYLQFLYPDSPEAWVIMGAIAGLFVVAWVYTLKRVCHTSWLLNRSKRLKFLPASPIDRDKDLLKVAWLGCISEWLVSLGLIGTVIGFSIALSSVDQGALISAQGAESGVRQLMLGMRVALNTTILGATLGIWHEVNFRLLSTTLGVYWCDRIKAGGEVIAR